MRKMKRMLVIAVVAAGFTLVNHASAQYQARGDDGIYASPRFRQMLNEQKKAPGTTADVIDRSLKRISPKMQALLDGQKRVAGVNHDPDLAHGRLLTGKHPFGATHTPEFQLAPLK